MPPAPMKKPGLGRLSLPVLPKRAAVIKSATMGSAPKNTEPLKPDRVPLDFLIAIWCEPSGVGGVLGPPVRRRPAGHPPTPSHPPAQRRRAASAQA